MKIEVIVKYYREEFLVPLFMLHYEPWVDKITFLTGKFQDGKFDDQICIQWQNEAVNRSDADWVIVVDMDEFVFPVPLGTNPRLALEQEPGDYCFCPMFYVWRHFDEPDLDRDKEPLMQRRYGHGFHHKHCIFRPGKGLVVEIGCHNLGGKERVTKGKDWSGAHWTNADPIFCLKRRIRDRKERLSDANLKLGLGYHNFIISEQSILADIESHKNDPLVIQ